MAINPNTVLKAYRELEHEGLAAGRPGRGTFITRSLPGSSPETHRSLRRGLPTGGWPRPAGWGSTTRASTHCSR